MQMANKLLYRSKQRGFLELDLLMGLWAEENIPRMDMRMMQEFSTVLDQVRLFGGKCPCMDQHMMQGFATLPDQVR